MDGNENNDEELNFEQPKELTSGSRFDLKYDFSRYRAGKEYEIQLVAESDEKSFDSFIIQVVGRLDDSGNFTFYGQWKSIPQIGELIDCGKYRGAAIVDKGRPIRFTTLSFTWKAPLKDVGSLRIRASVADGDFYQTISSERIRFETFPIPVIDCGRTLDCFKQCRTAPKCDPDDSEMLVTMGLDGRENDEKDIIFRLGGKLFTNSSDYVAIGIGSDYYMRNMDMVACSRDRNDVNIGHYFLENDESQPFEHRSKIGLLESQVDSKTGFAWCSFARPFRPESTLDLNLDHHLYYFYFKGTINPDDRSLSLPKLDEIQRSTLRRFNRTRAYYDVRYKPLAAASTSSPIGSMLILTAFLIINLV